MHDSDISQRLYSAESDFLTALDGGTKTLSSYHQSWSTLPDALSTATQTGCIGNDTFAFVNFVASRISNLANCFLRVKREEELSTSQLQGDCDAMFRQMDALHLNVRPKPIDLRTPILDAESSPPILASAHRWLLDNLHNPYPTAEVKARIAAASSCQVSSVNSWFINARRRIGWTTLCRERFSNCRADMLDAAYRALVDEDPSPALSPELAHSFVAIKVAAEGLYASILTRSALAGDLDTVVKDMTQQGGESNKTGKYHRVEQVNSMKAYPSPDSSRTVSPTPALGDLSTDESEEEGDVAPPIIAGVKRRRSSVVSIDEPSSTACRPIKRLRASTISRARLPSPPSSTYGIDEPSDHCSPSFSPTHVTLPETNSVCHDADPTGIPKDSVATPLLHTVSDPLPCPNTDNEHLIDDWFNTNFDALFTIPPPVDATQPDFAASWEVELFKDYSLPGNTKCAPTCLPALADTNLPAPSDLANLDNLFRSIGEDIFTTSPHGPPLSNISEALYTTSVDPPILDMSQTSLDWTPLLNDPGTCQPTIYSSFPQYPIYSDPLPEIDLSMIQFPHLMPADGSQGDFTSKQAKLDQFHAMQEAVRRMERELQSDGVLI